MFVNDRRNYIKKLLTQNKRIDVLRISSQLGVSEVTIRKDLDYLEKTGFLIRTHGGAVLNEAVPDTVPHPQEAAIPQNILTISRIAACLIGDGELIYLGTDTLCTSIASQLLSKKYLTIVTNNLTASLLLSENPDLKVIVPGGTIHKEQDICMLRGAETQEFLQHINYDKAILGADAIKFNSGFCLRDSDTRNIYRTVLEQADQKILAAGSECFNKNAFYPFTSLESADIIVSDERMPEDYIDYFSQHLIKVFTTYDLKTT